MTLANRRDRPAPQLGGPPNLHRTWKILAGGAEVFAQTLIDIADDPSMPAAARVTASKAGLEMVGFKTPETVNILPVEYDPAGAPAGEGSSPVARIRSRMAALAEKVHPDPDVVDAEIVEVVETEVIEAEVVD